MHPYVIEVFFKIIGLGAASGIFFKNNDVKVISDNSNYLFTYSISDSRLTKILLDDNLGQNDVVSKKDKLDLESISYYQNKLYILGSGSSGLAKRQHLFVVDQLNNVTKTDITAQFSKLRKALKISEEDFNIEGSFIHHDKYYLLNRGNGPQNKNGIIITDISMQQKPEFVAIDLSSRFPNLSFTDGTIVDDTLYFLAVAEETASTYDDGKIGGSYLGFMDIQTLTVENLIPISDSSKYEGLTLFKNDASTLEFLLCEDPDNDVQKSVIYKLILTK